MRRQPRLRRQRSAPILRTSALHDAFPLNDNNKRLLKRRVSKLATMTSFLLVLLGWWWAVMHAGARLLRQQQRSPQAMLTAVSQEEDGRVERKVRHQNLAHRKDVVMEEDQPSFEQQTEHPSAARATMENVLTYYLETPTLTRNGVKPLPRRRTKAEFLQKVVFPNATCDPSTSFLRLFPIETFPLVDPFLPWIHDYFVRQEEEPQHGGAASAVVQFVAQNRRRCETGEGKETVMKYWEPQMALFQSVPVHRVAKHNNSSSNDAQGFEYRLGSGVYNNATNVAETRFLCHFHDENSASEMTFSRSNIPYEYVNWRKHKGEPMFNTAGGDVHRFEFSQLLFMCPIPTRFRKDLIGLTSSSSPRNKIWLDIIPVRSPARRDQWWLSKEQVGPEYWKALPYFNATEEYGADHVLPSLQDSGRIANLALCPAISSTHHGDQQEEAGATSPNRNLTRSIATTSIQRRHQFVVCTWTAASYHRRGDSTKIEDAALRLEEWIVFHRLAGVDHIYLYDNTQISPSSLHEIALRFPDFVTYVPWPAKVCSNNRPNHKNPGERSSQYGAEASCRERYGSTTEWMSFIDTDEYLVPMRTNSTWADLLHDFSQTRPNVHVLKLRSSRGRPREHLMELLPDQSSCKPETRRKPRYVLDPCLTHDRNETFLRIYNCDFIKPPRPERFARAMKQIYRPAFVLSHFVHYSTITADIARYYRDWSKHSAKNFSRRVRDVEWADAFLAELDEGVLVHAKSVLPYETMSRTEKCQTGSKQSCPVGRVCPESTAFNDSIHTLNLFVDENNQFCNCWLNAHVEEYWVPRLERALQSLPGR